MAKMGKFDVSGFKNLQKKLNKIDKGNVDVFIDSCAKELTARLLAEVIKRTLPGQYPENSGKKGGTLRRGWTSKSHEEAAGGRWSADSAANSRAKSYAESLKIHRFENTLVAEVVNPVEYASYVEFGHRTANHKGWVRGKFMMTISEQEIQNIAPKVLEAKVKKYLRECMT